MELIKINEITNDFSNIEIKKYVSFAVKKLIVDNILKSVVSENEHGLKVIDYTLLPLIQEFTVVNNYTNIDMSEDDIIDAYDKLKESGIIDYVINSIDEEYWVIVNMLNSTIKQMVELENSLQGVIAKSLHTLLSKLPDEKGMAKLIKMLPKELNKISPESLKFVGEAIGWNKGN